MPAVRILLSLFCLCIAGTGIAPAQDFYKGKRVTMLINFAPGGPTDIEGRMVARYLGKYLTGNSGVVVQNMDGAGGVVGINYIGEIAPKDGTLIGFVTGAAFQNAIEPLSRRVDLKTYEFVAHQAGTNVYYARTDVKPGLRSAPDILKAEDLIAGGLGAENTKDLLMRLSLDLLGVKYRWVTGYKSNNAVRLALQKNEVSMFSESPPGFRALVMPAIIEKGEGIPLYYDPFHDGANFYKSKQMEGLDVLPFNEFYKKVFGKDPSGPLWDAYMAGVLLSNSMLRQVIMPPGVPREAVAAVRDAMSKLGSDPEFSAETMKTFGFVPEWIATANVAEVTRANMNIDPKTREFIIKYMKTPPSR